MPTKCIPGSPVAGPLPCRSPSPSSSDSRPSGRRRPPTISMGATPRATRCTSITRSGRSRAEEWVRPDRVRRPRQLDLRRQHSGHPRRGRSGALARRRHLARRQALRELDGRPHGDLSHLRRISIDGGQTWSADQRIDDAPAAVDGALRESGGARPNHVVAVWEDVRAGGWNWNVYFARATWNAGPGRFDWGARGARQHVGRLDGCELLHAPERGDGPLRPGPCRLDRLARRRLLPGLVPLLASTAGRAGAPRCASPIGSAISPSRGTLSRRRRLRRVEPARAALRLERLARQRRGRPLPECLLRPVDRRRGELVESERPRQRRHRLLPAGRQASRHDHLERRDRRRLVQRRLRRRERDAGEPLDRSRCDMGQRARP